MHHIQEHVLSDKIKIYLINISNTIITIISQIIIIINRLQNQSASSKCAVQSSLLDVLPVTHLAGHVCGDDVLAESGTFC